MVIVNLREETVGYKSWRKGTIQLCNLRIMVAVFNKEVRIASHKKLKGTVRQFNAVDS